MPAYEYRCRTCDTAFEVRRSLHDAPSAATPCPSGHDDTTRVFSAVAVARGGASAGAAPAPVPAGGGGCCGGGCCG